MTASDIAFWLKRFEVGEPIKSLFQPEFSLQPSRHEEHVDVVLKMKAPDAYGSGKIVDLQLTESIPLWDTPKDLAKYCAEYFRHMLYKAVTHEVDEAIIFNGQRVFDPHG